MLCLERRHGLRVENRVCPMRTLMNEMMGQTVEDGVIVRGCECTDKMGKGKGSFLVSDAVAELPGEVADIGVVEA